MRKISKQFAIDNGMFGPIYHGTSYSNREKIEKDGFRIFKSSDVGKRHGYPFRADHLHMPVDHLGYGVYFTTIKSIAKKFNQGSTSLKEYYLDTNNILTINYGNRNTMMEWYHSMGYDSKLAKTSPDEWHKQTEKMTDTIKSQYDAVWYKGKGLYKLTDGDQVCVYNIDVLVEIDPKMSSGYEIGSKVVRKSDGMKGVILKKRENKPSEYVIDKYNSGELPETSKFKRIIETGETLLLEVKWNKGGTEFDVFASDVEPINPSTINENVEENMKIYHLIKDGSVKSLIESAFIDTGVQLYGTSSLIESIQKFIESDYEMVIADPKNTPIVINESNAEDILAELTETKKEDETNIDDLLGESDDSIDDLLSSDENNEETTESVVIEEITEEEPVQEEVKPIVTRFGVRWEPNRLLVLDGSNEIESEVKILKVEGTTLLKVGEKAKITKPVIEGKPLYMLMLSGENKGKVFNSKNLTKLKIK